MEGEGTEVAYFRKAIGWEARDLEVFNRRLRQLLGRLPAPAHRREREAAGGSEESDEATELRAVLECVLADRLEPAVRELLAAAGPP